MGQASLSVCTRKAALEIVRTPDGYLRALHPTAGKPDRTYLSGPAGRFRSPAARA
jgi:hypothetical protein